MDPSGKEVRMICLNNLEGEFEKPNPGRETLTEVATKLAARLLNRGSFHAAHARDKTTNPQPQG
jgi:hypothetical protein